MKSQTRERVLFLSNLKENQYFTQNVARILSLTFYAKCFNFIVLGL
jgi:hypothetical protein